LRDSIAVGQVTPGPLLTTSTFVGYIRGSAIFGSVWGGIAGALVATAAIFLPAFVFVAILGPLLPRIRKNRYARGALNAVNAAVVALIFVVVARFAIGLWPSYPRNRPRRHLARRVAALEHQRHLGPALRRGSGGGNEGSGVEWRNEVEG